MSSQTQTILDGIGLSDLFAAGTQYVEKNVDTINALNVFPVPDGDTGINMLLTMRAASGALNKAELDTTPISEMSKILAKGALLGARGNSGVIFSQFMKGLAQGFSHLENAGPHDIANALDAASQASYRAVAKPVEGTMLTVMRAAADGARPEPTKYYETIAETLRHVYENAADALGKTPEQLPVLKEAGVVDAGGQALVVFLAGMLSRLEGAPVTLDIDSPMGDNTTIRVNHDFLEHSEEEMYGFCTQFLIHGRSMDADNLREQIEAIAVSTVVIGDDETIRIHAHADDPGPLLSLGVSLGIVDQVNIQNMDIQHQEFVTLHSNNDTTPKGLSVVAIVPGEGLVRIFNDLGASYVLLGGQTANPSAAELLEAAKSARSDHVILLPNNPNIIMAAKQAAELAEKTITVIESTSIPQGIAAMLAFNPEIDAAGNNVAMTNALGDVHSGEVTVAARETTVTGITVHTGQPIALLDGELVAGEATETDALLTMIEKFGPEDGSLVTLYFGSILNDTDASRAAEMILARFPGVEVEIHDGGQPYYHYLVSIE